MPTIRITEPVRANALRRPFVARVIKDAEVPGLGLHVTTRRSFWALTYQIRGVNPKTGRRFGGGTRHELSDAMLVGVQEARTAALAAKAVVRAGGDPLHAHMASRAVLEASRSILPTTVDDALDAYAKALVVRTTPSVRTRAQYIRGARKAVAHMNVGAAPIPAIDARMVRQLIETIPGSAAQRQHVYGGLRRFLTWCRKQGLVEHNVCGVLDRDDRPKPGRSRSHVPSIVTLKSVWASVEGEPMRDLIRLMLLLPLRRNEVAGLRWSEVQVDRVRISANRTKNAEAHELPLSPAARAILEARKAHATSELVFPSSNGTIYSGWNTLLARIRAKIGEAQNAKDDRFSLHDTRRAFVSHLASSFDVDALDQCLGHRRAGVHGVYQRSARWPERIAALNAYANLITGSEPDTNVVPLRAARGVL